MFFFSPTLLSLFDYHCFSAGRLISIIFIMVKGIHAWIQPRIPLDVCCYGKFPQCPAVGIQICMFNVWRWAVFQSSSLLLLLLFLHSRQSGYFGRMNLIKLWRLSLWGCVHTCALVSVYLCLETQSASVNMQDSSSRRNMDSNDVKTSSSLVFLLWFTLDLREHLEWLLGAMV